MSDQVLERLRSEIGGQPAALTRMRTIVDAIWGRPRVSPGGPTPMDILGPLLKTNTISYTDLLKIYQNCMRHTESERGVVMVLFGDGQTVLREHHAFIPPHAPAQMHLTRDVHAQVREI